MRYIMIPTWVLVIIMILAWIGVVYLFWFKPIVIPKLDNYFAQRRHLRRVRKYIEGDTSIDMTLYDVASIHPNNIYTPQPKKVPTHATARHRR